MVCSPEVEGTLYGEWLCSVSRDPWKSTAKIGCATKSRPSVAILLSDKIVAGGQKKMLRRDAPQDRIPYRKFWLAITGPPSPSFS